MSHSFFQALKDFKSGASTPRAFLEECAHAIKAREKTVKAFVTLDLKAARKSADASTRRYKAGKPLSPVDGCPIAVKDIIATADMPTQMNSPIYKGWRPKYDAACVAALKLGGAIIIGKTVTTEFAVGRSGPTTNPVDAKRTPGGSSSGSAAAVAAGMTPAALGTQTQGSVLRPASYCGAVGFKPTFGALHTGGIHILSATNDHLGVIADTVEDAWSVASQISLGVGSPGVGFLAGAGARVPAPQQPARLIRLYTRGWDETDTPARNAFNEAVERLKARGVEIASRYDDPEVAALEEQLERGIDGQRDIMAFDMKWPYADYIARHKSSVGPHIRELVERGQQITPAGYDALLTIRRGMQQLVASVLARADGFVTLASSGPAPIGLSHTGSRTYPSYASWLGLPAFSLPVMTVKGLPVGLQLIGRAGADGSLCAGARWVMRSESR